jgi:hypothetical protein
MSKHHDWGNCSFCPRKRSDRPIKRVEFSHAYSGRELICDFCLDILKNEGQTRGEEICQTCLVKATQNRTVILENFFKPVGGKCSCCEKKKESPEENNDESNNNKNPKNNQKYNDISKIFNTCTGCQKDISEEISYYLPGEELTRHWCANCYPKDNNNSSPPPPVSAPLNDSSSQNNQSNIKCYNCKKYFSYEENTHYFPQKPDKKWCDACDSEIKNCLQATQQIWQGQAVNIDNLNISTENKEELKALVKIKKGQPVDIDKLNIDEESKKELKELQKQIPATSPINKSQQRSKGITNYVVNCLACSKEYETDSQKKPHSTC